MSRESRFPAAKSVSVRPAAPAPHLKQPAEQTQSRRDGMSREAYLIYLSKGRPQEQDVQHGLQAEAQTMGPHKPGPGTVLL